MEQEVLLHKWIWGQSRKEADNFFSQGTSSRIILSSDVKKTDGMNIMKLNVDFDRGEFYIFEIFLFILFVWNGQWNETSHIPFLHNVTFLAGLEVITICTHSNIPMRIIWLGFCCGFCSIFHLPSIVTGVTSHLFLIVWWFRPQKPYIFWMQYHLGWRSWPRWPPGPPVPPGPHLATWPL